MYKMGWCGGFLGIYMLVSCFDFEISEFAKHNQIYHQMPTDEMKFMV